MLKPHGRSLYLFSLDCAELSYGCSSSGCYVVIPKGLFDNLIQHLKLNRLSKNKISWFGNQNRVC